jgi:hypothetical protein
LFGYDMTPMFPTVDSTTTKKSGYQPFGMAHASVNANERRCSPTTGPTTGAAVEWASLRNVPGGVRALTF